MEKSYKKFGIVFDAVSVTLLTIVLILAGTGKIDCFTSEILGAGSLITAFFTATLIQSYGR